MLLRRIMPVALALAGVAACEPSVGTRSTVAPGQPVGPGQSPSQIDYAIFDPVGQPPAIPPSIPLPNDLALQPSAIAAQTGAQKELLASFVAACPSQTVPSTGAPAGCGWPNDQEVPITISFQRVSIDGKTKVPTDLDLATFGATTLAAFELKPSATPVPATLDPIQEADYVKGTDTGVLTLHNQRHALSAGSTTQTRRWNAGSKYIVAVRGGGNGVKAKDGAPVEPQSVLYFLTQGKDLSRPENQPVAFGATVDARAATGARLEQLRQALLPAFQLVSAVFPPAEIASIQAFTVAPAQPGGAVVVDQSAGIVPLPSDLLLDPANGGKTIVNNPAFGPLAAGLATLDGFSTTAMILSQTSAPVVAGTVNPGTVFLYDLSNPAAPARLKEVRETAPTFAGAAFVAEPFAITQKADATPCAATDPAAGCFSTAIGLQPAVLVNASPLVTLPPLKEGTEYAVLVTDDVLVAPIPSVTTTTTPLQPSTVSRILLFENPLADASGKSLLAGQADATAAGLEKIRLGVKAAAAALQAEKGIAKSKIVLGYTFRTQTVTTPALQLAAAPYQNAAAFVPQAVADISGQAGVPTLPSGSAVLLATVPTLNPINVQTGALEPDSSKWTAAALSAVVVVPPASAVTAACPAPAAALKCAPLVVFQHGLGRSKTDAFGIANALATAGFVVAAIDAPLHGDRAICTADAQCTCTALGAASTCTPKCGLFGPAGLQGDAVAIGQCTSGSVAASSVSGAFLVTQNFFRTRDALREDILDNSALVLALAPPAASTNPFSSALGARGVAVDPSKVYWVGQSLGGILGTLNAATNPRIGRAVLNVPGAPVVDVFTNSPAFATQVGALLASLDPPIVKGTPQYLQFIQVAKLVLDGAEPLNFAPHLLGDAAHPTLPNLLATGGAALQAPKNVFGQYAICDQTIPNTYNLTLFGETGLTSNGANPAGGAQLQSGYTAYTITGAGTPPACTGTNPHGFLLPPISGTPDPNTGVAQSDVAAFLQNLTIPTTDR